MSLSVPQLLENPASFFRLTGYVIAPSSPWPGVDVRWEPMKETAIKHLKVSIPKRSLGYWCPGRLVLADFTGTGTLDPCQEWQIRVAGRYRDTILGELTTIVSDLRASFPLKSHLPFSKVTALLVSKVKSLVTAEDRAHCEEYLRGPDVEGAKHRLARRIDAIGLALEVFVCSGDIVEIVRATAAPSSFITDTRMLDLCPTFMNVHMTHVFHAPLVFEELKVPFLPPSRFPRMMRRLSVG